MTQSHFRQQRTGRFALPAALASSLVLATFFCGSAWSQSAPLPAPGSTISDSDRAKRDADKVFQWIRIHSDKPRKIAAAAPPLASAAPVAVTRPKAASKANDSGITESVTPLATARSEPPREASVPAASTPGETTTAIAQPAADKQSDTVVASIAPRAQVDIEEDLALIPVHRTEPEFSTALMRSLRKGEVKVSFTVKPDGTVTQAQALSSTHPRLKDVAVATVQEWRFQPLRHAQQGVVDLGFNLD